MLPQPLLVLHWNAAVREHVRRATPDRLRMEAVADWNALRAAVRTAPAGTVTLVDPTHGQAGRGPAPDLSFLLRDYPRLRVVARVLANPAGYGDALTLGAWGVAHVLVAGTGDGLAPLRRRLETERAHHFLRVLDAVRGPRLATGAWALIAGALDVAGARGNAEDWTAVWGGSGRTLLRRCHDAKLPPPRRLLAWMRTLLAADLLDCPGHTLATAGAACGYAAGPPLSRILGQLTRTPAPELVRAGDVLAIVARCFVAELAERRDARVEP